MTRLDLTGCPLSPWGRLACACLAGLFGGLLWLATSVQPDPRGYGTHEQLGLAPCGFRALFHVPCPTCGGTTSYAHFVRGEWRQSFQSNSAAFTFALLSTFLIPWLVLSAITGRLLGVIQIDWTFISIVAFLAAVSLSHWLIRVLPALR